MVSRMNTSELVGAAACVWNVPNNYYLPDRIWRAELKKGVNPIFLWQVLIQAETRALITSAAGGTSDSMKNISKEDLLSIPVISVTPDEQAAFAEYVVKIHGKEVSLKNEMLRGKSEYLKIIDSCYE